MPTNSIYLSRMEMMVFTAQLLEHITQDGNPAKSDSLEYLIINSISETEESKARNEQIIKKQCFDKIKGPDGLTLLIMSCNLGLREIISYLSKLGVDVNETDDNADAPMHVAALNGSLASIKELIKCGAQINIRNMNHKTPLICACSNIFLGVNHHDKHTCAMELLAANADSMATTRTGLTALHYAVQVKKTPESETKDNWFVVNKTIDALLDSGLSIDCQEFSAKSPLFWAVEKASPSFVIEHLLHRGADPTLTDIKKNTLLHACAKYSHANEALCLLEGGVNIDAVNIEGETALDIARKMGKDHWCQTVQSWKDSRSARKAISELMNLNKKYTHMIKNI